MRLEECGLIRVQGLELTPDLAILERYATGLVARLPIAQLLEQDPFLDRYFRHGRLNSVPENPPVRKRLADLLVQLLPADRVMSEAEVNGVLGSVYDDYAALRRILVDYRLLSRNGSSDYRRVG